MTKRVQTGLVSANFMTLRIFQTFAHNYDTAAVGSDDLFDPVQKFFLIERNLWEQNDMRSMPIGAASQDSPGSDPPSSATHDLNNAASAFQRRHAANIHRHFHDGSSVVLDYGTISRA